MVPWRLSEQLLGIHCIIQQNMIACTLIKARISTCAWLCTYKTNFLIITLPHGQDKNKKGKVNTFFYSLCWIMVCNRLVTYHLVRCLPHTQKFYSHLQTELTDSQVFLRELLLLSDLWIHPKTPFRLSSMKCKEDDKNMPACLSSLRRSQWSVQKVLEGNGVSPQAKGVSDSISAVYYLIYREENIWKLWDLQVTSIFYRRL